MENVIRDKLYPSLGWVVFYEDADDQEHWTWIRILWWPLCRAANSICEAEAYVWRRVSGTTKNPLAKLTM